jgi:hypothetical protein
MNDTVACGTSTPFVMFDVDVWQEGGQARLKKPFWAMTTIMIICILIKLLLRSISKQSLGIE